MRTLWLLVLLTVGTPALAVEVPQWDGFWSSFGMGFGRLRTRPEGAGDEFATRLYLALDVGYTATPRLQLGVEFNRSSVAAIDFWDSSKGQGLTQALLIARYRPDPGSPLFLKLGGGLSSHWDRRPDATNGEGSAYLLGIGYDFATYGASTTAWFLDWSGGYVSGHSATSNAVRNEDFRTLNAGLSFGF